MNRRMLLTTLKRVTFAACLLLSLASCRRRPLDFVLYRVRVELENDYAMPYVQTKAVPYHYNLMFFDRGDNTLTFEEYCAEKGGWINSVPGSYCMFAFDMDNAVTKFDGRDCLSTLRAYTDDEAAPVVKLFNASRTAARKASMSVRSESGESKGAPGFENERVIKEPNAVFGGLNPDADIPYLGYEDEEYVIPDSDRFLLSQGRLTIYGISHTEHIASVQVFITNLAESKYIVTGTPVQKPVTQWFYMSEVSEEYLRGHFVYFGKVTEPEPVNTAYVVITDVGGGKYLYVMDVTDQIVSQEDNADLVLRIDFSVPDSSDGNAGFEPVVEEWGIVWNDIGIGK